MPRDTSSNLLRQAQDAVLVGFHNLKTECPHSVTAPFGLRSSLK
jgi:hypothetical protein